jgi:NCAIR mutase (PurE)-related protein
MLTTCQTGIGMANVDNAVVSGQETVRTILPLFTRLVAHYC